MSVCKESRLIHTGVGVGSLYRAARLSLLVVSVLVAQFLLSGELRAQSAVRTITSLGPPEMTVGDPTFTIQVIGTNFQQGDTVLLGSTPLTTTFVSATL